MKRCEKSVAVQDDVGCIYLHVLLTTQQEGHGIKLLTGKRGVGMEDGCYYWAVVCKNHRFHNKQNTLFGHKIRLGETDSYSPLPALDRRFSVRCDDCGREHAYKPSDLVRVQLEYIDFFVPHPFFMSESTTLDRSSDQLDISPVSPSTDSVTQSGDFRGGRNEVADSGPTAKTVSAVFHWSRSFYGSQTGRLISFAARMRSGMGSSFRYAFGVATAWQHRGRSIFGRRLSILVGEIASALKSRQQ